MSDLPPSSTPPNTDSPGPARFGAVFEELKVHLTDPQKAIRKGRYARQGFIPPGITWHGILLTDGVDQEIAEELQLPFESREIDLADENEARLWVVERVLESPRLNAFQKIRANLQRKTFLRELGRRRMAAGGEGLTEMSNLTSHNTRAEIAKTSGSSQGQVHKVETLLEQADTAVLQQLEAGKLKIGAAFDALRHLPATQEQSEQYGVIYVAVPPDADAKKLAALPVGRLAAEDAALLCRVQPWALALVLPFLRHWGFAYATHFVLPLSRGLIRDFALEDHDILLLATRGDVGKPAVEDCPSSLLPTGNSEEQSIEAVFTFIESLFPEGAKVQLCPGQRRAGWGECNSSNGTSKPG